MEQERLDEILSEGYLDGLDALSMDDLRARRDACRAVEQVVSYRRRVLHGRLDLVRGELQRRDLGAAADLGQLLAELADPATPGMARSSMHVDVEVDDDGDDELALPADTVLARLTEADDGELRAAVDAWLELERRLSSVRTALHARIDALQAALVDRYRAGVAHVDDFLGR